MTDFSYLKAMEVTTDLTVEYEIHQISVNGKTPKLHMKPAVQANAPYFNALLKIAAKNAKSVQAGQVNTGMISETRDQDRELFPKHVITGWSDMPDADGAEVKFSAETCRDFLDQLPDHIFDVIRNFATTPENFVDNVDIEVTAKNSPSA